MISVRMNPGQITFTLMPWVPYSMAADLLTPMIPCLAAL